MVSGRPRWDSVDWNAKDPGEFLEFLDQTEPLSPERLARVDQMLDHLSGFGFEGESFADESLTGLRAD